MTKEELYSKITSRVSQEDELDRLVMLWVFATTMIERMAIEHEFMIVWNELYPEDK